MSIESCDAVNLSNKDSVFYIITFSLIKIFVYYKFLFIYSFIFNHFLIICYFLKKGGILNIINHINNILLNINTNSSIKK